MPPATQLEYYISIAFVFGICIGSFLNVCIYRIPQKKSIVSPASSCPTCGKTIPFYCNIPILSYILLKGKCRYCRQPISIRYPLVELLTGLVASALFYRFGPSPEAVFWFVFACALITISFIDFDHQIIPDIISIPGIFIFASAPIILSEMTFLSTIFGILLGGGGLAAVSSGYYFIRKKEGIGGGDIKLLAMIGAATGVTGVIFTIFSSSLIGTIVGVALSVTSKTNIAALRIPFGPFLSTGAFIYVMWGEKLISWYLGLLRL